MRELQDFAIGLFCSLKLEGEEGFKIPYSSMGRRFEFDRALKKVVDSKRFSSELTSKLNFSSDGECIQLQNLISRACESRLICNGSLDRGGYEFLITPGCAEGMLERYEDCSKIRGFAKAVLNELPKSYD